MEANGNTEFLGINEDNDLVRLTGVHQVTCTVKDIINVAHLAACGDFEVRIQGTEGESDLALLGRTINGLLDVTDAFVREARASLQHASQGKFYRRVLLRGMPGTFRLAADEINLAASEIQKKEVQVKEAEQRRLSMADDLEASIQSVVSTVASSATELQATAQNLAALAHQSTTQAKTVSDAAEQSSANVNSIAAATEQLTRSVEEVARQAKTSSAATESAVAESGNATNIMKSLNEASQKIGKVVKFITDIASQTNLLALNATIEAARAGEAGRGFAVVASEVKNLARQTSQATEEISGEVSAIQKSSNEAVTAVETVAEMIGKVNTIAGTIGQSVTEQLFATGEISKNSQQSAVLANEVTSNIIGVSQATNETSVAVSQLMDAATELSRQSEALQGTIAKFVAEIRNG